jgi:polyisoprenoid-binding protein YceI
VGPEEEREREKEELMRIANWKSAIASAVGVFGIGMLLSAAPARPRPETLQAAQAATHELVINFDPAQTKVHFRVDATMHVVHGTFALKSGTLRFNPQTGKADGAIVVNAASGESGNDSRDSRMHKEILETWKYAEATFRPKEIEGQVALNAACDFRIKGILTVHGGEHEIVVPVHSQLSGDHWKGSAKFEVPYVKWGIKDPSNFFLHVKPVVNIEMEMVGTESAGD